MIRSRARIEHRALGYRSCERCIESIWEADTGIVGVMVANVKLWVSTADCWACGILQRLYTLFGSLIPSLLWGWQYTTGSEDCTVHIVEIDYL